MSIPDDDGNYYSEQCSRCRWGEWRGGCLNPASAEDLSDMDAAYKKGACRVFEAGKPQPDQAPKTLYVQMPKEVLDKMVAERDALRSRVEKAEAAQDMLLGFVGFARQIATLTAPQGEEEGAADQLSHEDLPFLLEHVRERLQLAEGYRSFAVSVSDLMEEKGDHQGLLTYAGLPSLLDSVKSLGVERDALRARAEKAEAEVARLQNACVHLNSVVSRIDYVMGEPNEMECSPYDVHANPDAVVQGVVELRARAEKSEAALVTARAEGAKEERAAVVAWLRRNPGVSRAPGCITAMTPFECADAIEAKGTPVTILRP